MQALSSAGDFVILEGRKCTREWNCSVTRSTRIAPACLRDCCAPVGSSRCTPTARQQPHETIVPPSHLKRKLTDTESEIRQPLQMFGLVARHRAKVPASRVASAFWSPPIRASERVGLNSSAKSEAQPPNLEVRRQGFPCPSRLSRPTGCPPGCRRVFA